MPDSSHATAERVAIDAAGRLVVPARFRKALGIPGRGAVVVEMVVDSLRIHTVEGALERWPPAFWTLRRCWQRSTRSPVGTA